MRKLRWTLGTRREQRETREEQQWNKRNGPVTVSHITTHEDETPIFQNTEPYAEDENDFSCDC